MRVEAPMWLAGIIAIATATAQFLVLAGKMRWNRWPLLVNPTRGVGLAYGGGLLLVGSVALVAGLH